MQPSSYNVRQYRDLTMMNLPDGSILVIACDSLGGIGPKSQDTFTVPGYIVGRFAARVPLMEVMATGAKPQILVNTLSVEMSPTGQEILRGIRGEILAASLDIPIITGSTEENVQTCQTGVGITVIGLLANQEAFRAGPASKGNLVICVGKPKVGDEVHLEDNEIAALSLLQDILQLTYVTDILPVGSKGIAYEANLMAQTAGLALRLSETGPFSACSQNLTKSAGPATCLLCSLPPDYLAHFRKHVQSPVAVVGQVL
ncbi:MAG: hypothetical protein GX354_00550 [Firmicutes bacterium]|nr:hypothetical protein [Bacillota bacterium]